jgi:hypothetical protein
MVGLGALPSVVQLAALHMLPESRQSFFLYLSLSVP